MKPFFSLRSEPSKSNNILAQTLYSKVGKTQLSVYTHTNCNISDHHILYAICVMSSQLAAIFSHLSLKGIISEPLLAFYITICYYNTSALGAPLQCAYTQQKSSTCMFTSHSVKQDDMFLLKHSRWPLQL